MAVPTLVLNLTDRLSDEELLIAYCREGQQWARTAIIERSLPLARRLAARYRHAEQPLEDLVQVACMGLVNAVDRFDPDRSARFSSYAVPTMLGELKRHFRDQGWAVHVPRDLQERALALGRASESLARTLGRSRRWASWPSLWAGTRSRCSRPARRCTATTPHRLTHL